MLKGLTRLAIIVLPTLIFACSWFGFKAVFNPSKTESFNLWLPTNAVIDQEGKVWGEKEVARKQSLSPSICDKSTSEDFALFQKSDPQGSVNVFLVRDHTGFFTNDQITAIYLSNSEEKRLFCNSLATQSAGTKTISYKLEANQVTVRYNLDAIAWFLDVIKGINSSNPILYVPYFVIFLTGVGFLVLLTLWVEDLTRVREA